MGDEMECDMSTAKDLINLTSGHDARDYEYTPAYVTLLTIVNPCILLIGLLSNGTFLFVVCRIRWMRSIINLYLVNLAVADLLFLLVSTLEKLAKYTVSLYVGDESAWGPVGCVVVYLASDTGSYASLCIVTLISFERYQAICRPLQHRIASSWRRHVLYVSSGWCLTFLFAGCLTPGNSVFDIYCVIWPDSDRYSSYPRKIGRCNPVVEGVADITNGLQTLPFLVALPLNAVLYVKVIKQLRHGERPGSEDTSLPEVVFRRRSRARNQVSRMLLLNGVVAFVCLAPWYLGSFSIMILALVRPDFSGLLNENQLFVLFQFSLTMAYVNACINPLIYNACSSRYRKAFRAAFCRCFRNRIKPAN